MYRDLFWIVVLATAVAVIVWVMALPLLRRSSIDPGAGGHIFLWADPKGFPKKLTVEPEAEFGKWQFELLERGDDRGLSELAAEKQDPPTKSERSL
jgi:hypothetical protein